MAYVDPHYILYNQFNNNINYSSENRYIRNNLITTGKDYECI